MGALLRSPHLSATDRHSQGYAFDRFKSVVANSRTEFKRVRVTIERGLDRARLLEGATKASSSSAVDALLREQAGMDRSIDMTSDTIQMATASHSSLGTQRRTLQVSTFLFLFPKCLMPDAECSMPDAECSMRNAKCSMCDARCSMPDAECSMPEAECSMLDAKCSMLEAECSMLDARR
jgi:hypothetical protein